MLPLVSFPLFPHPQDIEYVVQDAAPIARPGCVAAFSLTELGGSIEVIPPRTFPLHERQTISPRLK